MREYVVCLNNGINYKEFWDQIENESDTDGFVPERRVDIADNRDGSELSCHYFLEDDEALKLSEDPRVFCVEIPPEEMEGIIAEPDIRVSGIFYRGWSSYYLPWSFIRTTNRDNPWGNTTGSIHTNYDFTLDGEGIDFVSHDTGIQVNHPEFRDKDGFSRVETIDWFAETGIEGSMPENHYVDGHGHGTHTTGTVAGKHYGWAPNAKIYSMKILSSGNTTPLNQLKSFDLLRTWHLQKPIDPKTGVRRPTVVNMSWGYYNFFDGFVGGNYRGQDWVGTTKEKSKGMIGDGNNHFGFRIGSLDSALQECVNAGIHFVKSAGNTSQRIDYTGGQDYNNYFIGNNTKKYYYMRGGSPIVDDITCVGALDFTNYVNGLETKASFSECGPRVDIYAPGVAILSSMSTLSGSGYSYPWQPDYKCASWQGTSMATPNVAGVMCVLLQQKPWLTPAELKQEIIDYSTKNKMYTTGLDNDYTNYDSLKGGNGYILYNPWNSNEYSQEFTTKLKGNNAPTRTPYVIPSVNLPNPIIDLPLTDNGDDVTGNYTTSVSNVTFDGTKAIFNGNSSITTNENLALTNIFTWSCWMKDTETNTYGYPTSKRYYLSMEDTVGGSNRSISFRYYEPEVEHRFSIFTGITPGYALECAVAEATGFGVWTKDRLNLHTFVYTQSECKIYVNGKLSNGWTITYNHNYDKNDVQKRIEGAFTVGAGTTPFYGEMALVKFFDVALTEPQVKQLYRDGALQLF